MNEANRELLDADAELRREKNEEMAKHQNDDDRPAKDDADVEVGAVPMKDSHEDRPAS